ncbi:unnamed protein product [Blepharisma stoltei]|uniref:Uncharacterized protein n=1 Tax=Blepharisma stoltei TaxID=1481888 RepID=A0AAU9K1V3_9CILI|nr:unnamed protein product [Blepharisma stoltei]
MQSQWIEAKISDTWDHDQATKRHKDRLNEIKNKSSNRIDNSPPTTRQIMQHKAKSQSSLDLKKCREIDRENEKIMTRISQIITDKRYNFSFNPAAGPNTLNSVKRKREAEKIAVENEKLIKKIQDLQSNLNKKKLLGDYQNFVKYSQQMSKYWNKKKSYPKFEGKPNRLPPLENLDKNTHNYSPDVKKGLKRYASEKSFKLRQSEATPKGVKSEIQSANREQEIIKEIDKENLKESDKNKENEQVIANSDEKQEEGNGLV